MEPLPDITAFRRRHSELNARLGASDFYADQRRAAAELREMQKLAKLLEAHAQLEKTVAELEGNEALANDLKADAELRELANEELPALREAVENQRRALLTLMIPPDPADSRNTVVEVRAGAGGDEASLFAAEMARLYQRFAETKGWKVEQLGASPSEVGGIKETSFLISGEDAHKTLKFESGVHRVQRIPATEANGRIHTSTITVAVLPEAEEVDLSIDPTDLEITVARASGPGGQGVNTTDSAVQIIHKPTGVIVKCSDERSQLKNKEKAMKVLRARLLAAKEEEEHAKYAAHRKAQIGSGDRSERIRTYNFPQGRVTDHRIGLTVHGIDQFMEGNIGDMVEALWQADLDLKLKELAAEAERAKVGA